MPERLALNRPQPRRAPVILVVNHQEWSARSLESILMPASYAVLRAFTGAHGLELARANSPDIIIVEHSLPDLGGLVFCRTLREQQIISDRVPVFFYLPERPTRTERLAALRAGAWDVLAPPIDAEELLIRFETLVRAKADGDRVVERALLDETTHFYSVSGLEFRAAELAAWAHRHAEPLSCVVLGFARVGADEAKVADAAHAMTEVLRKTSRTSDAVGRTGDFEFAVLAPGTDGSAAVRLAERLASAVHAALSAQGRNDPSIQLRGGMTPSATTTAPRSRDRN